MILSSCGGRKTLDDKSKTTTKQVEAKIATAPPPPGLSGAPTVAESNTATVWFTRADGDHLTFVAQTRQSATNFADTTEAITFALNELLSGPKIIAPSQSPSQSSSQSPSSSQSSSQSPSSNSSQSSSQSLSHNSNAGQTSSPSQSQSQKQSQKQSQSHDQGASQDQSGNEPQPPSISSEIPKGTNLIKVTEDKSAGTVTIDLSHPFVEGGGSDSFETRLEQIRRTIAIPAGKKPVYLDVDGVRLTSSSDGLEVKQPINDVTPANAPSSTSSNSPTN